MEQPRLQAARSAIVVTVVAALSCVSVLAVRAAEPQTKRPPRPTFVKAVVVDPADHFGRQPDAREFSKSLLERLASQGVNTVYLNAYNVAYGAYYETSYPYNAQTPYGRQDLLGTFIDQAHRRDIRVFAALYDHEHAPAWKANPSWRAKTKSGRDYEPAGTEVTHFLSISHPEARAWWMGFVEDLVTRYPALDGVELREPVVNWWGDAADYNPAATEAFLEKHPDEALGGETWRKFREKQLTAFLKDEISIVQRSGMEAHVTTVASALESGELMSVSRQARETGFDLDALLDGSVRPNAIKPEIMWQQWAAVYGYDTFTPKWTAGAVDKFVDYVKGRVPVVIHVEATDFGSHWMSLDEIEQMLLSSVRAGVSGIDLYSADLVERKQAWGIVSSFFRSSGKRVDAAAGSPSLILYDGKRGELARLGAVQLANLLGHFGADSRLHPVEEYRKGEVKDFDRVFYLGSKFGNAPSVFAKDLVDYSGQIVWSGLNLFALKEAGMTFPIDNTTQDAPIEKRKVEYRGLVMADQGELVPTEVYPGAKVVAHIRDGSKLRPFVVRAGNLWYIAGSPFDFPERVNGRYAVFADALHDILGIAHEHDEHQSRAFLRIEDVNPMTDPRPLRAIADTLAAREQPFIVAFFPFYVDPAAKVRVSLTQRPELADALRYMVSKGGSIVLHGSTHQYDGRSGIDWEFWDPETAGGVPEDGGEYVRAKVESALREVWVNDIHPIAWETPHYGATALDYSLFGSYFTTFVERRIYGVVGKDDYQQAMPYLIEKDVHGAKIVPENLGYVREEADVDRILTDAKSLRAVRDSIAGAFVHPTVSPDVIARIADGFEDLGYEPFDLRDVPSTVRTATRVETTDPGRVELPIGEGRFVEERVLGAHGGVLHEEREAVASQRYSSTLDVGDGRILSIAVDPPEIIKRGLSATIRSVREHADRAVIMLGFLGAGLLLIAYAQLKVQGAVEVRRAVPAYRTPPARREEQLPALPSGATVGAAGPVRGLVLMSFAAAGAAYGVIDQRARENGFEEPSP